MTDTKSPNKPHFILNNNGQIESFTSPARGGGGTKIPIQDRQNHGNILLGKIQQLAPIFAQAKNIQEQAGIENGIGLQIEFESLQGVELAFESLARERSGIELRNVRESNGRTYATVFVPDGKLIFFEKLISTYLDENADTKSGPKNSKLLNAIADIRAATLQALWTDTPETLPATDDESLWWEVWLPVQADRAAVVSRFRTAAEGLNFRLAPGELQFPERTVLLLYGNAAQMKRSMMTLNSIAELRRAKETADFFDSLAPSEQPSWLNDLTPRLIAPDANAPHICLLDSGVNHGHPLIAQALSHPDLHTVDPAWGVSDNAGHGTGMAGIALFGNLTDALVDQARFKLTHRLESVKLIPSNSANGNDPKHHGYLTIEAISRPEISAPNRQRLFSMAVTAKDNRDRGRPSAWSATIDRLVYDAEGQGSSPRLFIISAGNVTNPNAWASYPDSNSTDAIHDPAQAWNAITVGAFTELVNITEPNTTHFQPIAVAGGLSPFSTTSQTWQQHWPLKPDVVFEGGNVAKDGISAVWMPSLSLLTTHSNPTERLFTITNATSAASALAAKMAAELMAEYPNLWPETIRALVIHSAQWTPAMKQMYLPDKGKPTKAHMVNLIRHCGFGVPDIKRALWSVTNSLTLICEEHLYPFKRDAKKEPQLRDMCLHRLPWPLEELEALGNTPVEMRVTLSYFIEPNPSARGVTSRYRYESHGLRFDVKRPSESESDFRGRINVAAKNEEEGTHTTGSDNDWVLGTKSRHKGSVHSDIWQGAAADLASRGVIGVYPALGWWKTRSALERYNQSVRYSLTISISAPNTEVDLYTAVENQIKTTVSAQY